MSVYIGTREYGYGRMRMSHMVADTEAELHAMAHTIGLNRKWFQNKAGKVPHYDVSKIKKQLALKLGALLISDKQIIKKFRS